jgi:hypothetical protein
MLDRPPVHHPGRVARDQNEHFGRVGEAQRLEGELRQKAVPGDMIDKDAKEGHAAKEIEPKVALQARGSTTAAHLSPYSQGIDHAPEAWPGNPRVSTVQYYGILPSESRRGSVANRPLARPFGDALCRHSTRGKEGRPSLVH